MIISKSDLSKGLGWQNIWTHDRYVILLLKCKKSCYTWSVANLETGYKIIKFHTKFKAGFSQEIYTNWICTCNFVVPYKMSYYYNRIFMYKSVKDIDLITFEIAIWMIRAKIILFLVNLKNP